MVSKPSALRSHWIIAAGVLLAGCAGDGYTSGKKVEVACDTFPIKISYEEKDVWDSKCVRRNISDSTLVSTNYYRFFRFIYDGYTAYANVQFAEAGMGTVLNVRSVKDTMFAYSFVRKNGFGWVESGQTTIAGRDYDYINFSLPQGRSCTGFSHYSEIKFQAYANNFYGYVCYYYKKIDVPQLVEFLKHVKYE